MTDQDSTFDPGDRRSAPRGRLRVLGDVLYRVLRFTARHVHGFYTALIAYLSFAFILALAGIWGFAELAGEVLEGTTQTFDEAVLTWLATHRTPGLDEIALDITALGNTATMVVLVLVASVFLWLTHHRLSVALLMIAVAGGGLVNTLLKDIFDRPRPIVVEHLSEVTSESFPSGHAMTAMVAYGCVAYLGGRLEPTPRLRWTTWGFAALLILAIGASRAYIGVHYPSDIVGGFIAGLAWLAFVISGMHAIQYLARRKPEVVEEERDLHAEEERERGLRE